MQPLVVSDFGITVRVQDSCLIVEDRKHKQVYAKIEPRQTLHDTLVFSEHAGSISFEAINWLSGHNISVYFMRWNGHLMSVLLPRRANNMNKVRMAQYAAVSDPAKRLEVAKAFIAEKFRLSKIVLEHIKSKQETFEYVERFVLEARDSKKIPSLMACEAVVAEAYWKEIQTYLKRIAPSLKFQGRRGVRESYSKSATDIPNCCFNYLYGIQAAHTRSLLNAHTLDPTLSFLHYSINNEGLVWDFQELSRGYYDLCLLELVEDGKIQKDGFYHTDDYFLRLEWETSELLVKKVSEKLNSKIPYRGQEWTIEGVQYKHGHTLGDYLLGRKRDLHF